MGEHVRSDLELSSLLRARGYTLSVSLEEGDGAFVKLIYEARSASRGHACAIHTVFQAGDATSLAFEIRKIRGNLVKEIDRQAVNFPSLRDAIAMARAGAEDVDADGRPVPNA